MCFSMLMFSPGIAGTYILRKPGMGVVRAGCNFSMRENVLPVSAFCAAFAARPGVVPAREARCGIHNVA